MLKIQNFKIQRGKIWKFPDLPQKNFEIYKSVTKKWVNSKFTAQKFANCKSRTLNFRKLQIQCEKFQNFHINHAKILNSINPIGKIWKFPDLLHKGLENY